MRLDLVSHVEDRLLEHLRDVHVLQLDPHLVLLDTPKVEDVLEHSRQVVAFVQR